LWRVLRSSISVSTAGKQMNLFAPIRRVKILTVVCSKPCNATTVSMWRRRNLQRNRIVLREAFLGMLKGINCSPQRWFLQICFSTPLIVIQTLLPRSAVSQRHAGRLMRNSPSPWWSSNSMRSVFTSFNKSFWYINVVPSVKALFV